MKKRLLVALAAFALVAAAAAPAFAFAPNGKGAAGIHNGYMMSGGASGMAKVCAFCHGM